MFSIISLVILICSVVSGQINNGNFEFSTTCDRLSCDDIEISCIDDWWAYDDTDPDLFAWFKYNLCGLSQLQNQICDPNALEERGIWLQTGNFIDEPRNPIRVATTNPYYGANPNAVYKLQFDFIPFSSSPLNIEAAVEVSGSNDMTQGSVTTLATTEEPVIGCERIVFFFDHDNGLNPIPLITTFQYLVFSITPLDGGGGLNPPIQDRQVRGIIDNVSMCKVIDIQIQDDCEPPCVVVSYDESCYSFSCNEVNCQTQLQAFLAEDTYINYDEPGTLSSIYECLQLEESISGFEVTFNTKNDQNPDGFDISFQHALNECVDFTIDQNTVWNAANVPNDGKFRNLTIESGFTLTIESDLTLTFCEGGRLIVEPNATLHLSGTLTTDCVVGWQGVEVYGDASHNQSFDASIQGYHQGRVFMHPESKIENAITAARLYGPGTADTGGQLYADGAQFLNNSQAVVFYPYTNFVLSGGTTSKPRPYASSIEGCEFTVDNQYILEIPFSSHIFMISVDELQIFGSDFINTMSLPEASNIYQYGLAIHAISAGFRVDDLPCPEPCQEVKRSTFSGFGSAIASYRIFENKPFVVNHAVFQQNYYGISMLGVSGTSLTNNSFLFNTVPNDNIRNDQIGIHLRGNILTLNVQENHFVRSGGTVDITMGIIAEALGHENLAIRSNHFTGLSVGNEAFGINALNSGFVPEGLHYLCNQNTAGIDKDFYVLEASIYGMNIIRREQKDIGFDGPFPANFAAGNTFSETGNPFNGDFANYGNDQLLYFYYPQGLNEYPVNDAGIIEKIQAPVNECQNIICRIPCINFDDISDVKALFFENKDLYEYAVFESDTMLAHYYRMRLDSNLVNIIEYIMYDTTSVDRRDSLRLWLTRSSSLSGDLWLAADYMASGEYATADDMLDSIMIRHYLSIDQENDIDRLRTVYTILSTRTLLELDSATKVQLQAIAEQEGVSAAVARGALSIGGLHYVPTYYVPGEVNPRTDSSTEKIWPTLRADNVFPNPANDHIVINVGQSLINENTILVLYDFTGRECLKQLMQPGQNLISLSKISTGLVYFCVFTAGKAVTKGTFIKM